MRLHVDTDFAGDPDDACALVMVLGWPGVELTGVTTTADPDGRRAGYARHLLSLLGAADVPVAAGAGRSSTTGRPMGALPEHRRYWGDAPQPAAAPQHPSAALELIMRSIDQGARIAAIGPYTNLGLLEQTQPGALDGVEVYTMGGWVDPLPAGFPDWGPSRDWNVQCDTDAALTLFGGRADLTFVPCAAAVTAALRTTDLPRLSASGPVGSLLARQSSSYGGERGYAELAARHAAPPVDLVNFHWDPVTCAVALGWSHVTTSEMLLRPVLDDGVLRFERHADGRRTRVITAVDGENFTETWLTSVEAAQRRMPSRSTGTAAP